MLIRFKISNYCSFKEEQELSMTPGRTEGNGCHILPIEGFPLLRSSAIYGANASGKSNLIKALNSMKRFIVFDEKIPTDRYHRPDPEMTDTPSYFEMELEIDGTAYSYGFDYVISEQRIEDEWLFRLSLEGDNEIIFTRVGKHINHSFEGSDKQKLDVYAEDTSGHDDRLFLNVMGRRVRPNDGGLGVFNDIYDWFKNDLVFIDTDFPFSPEIPVSDRELENVNRIMSTFGTGVNNIAYDRKDGLEEFIPQSLMDALRRDLSQGKGQAALNIGSTRYASVNGYRAYMENGRVVFDEIVYRHNGDRISFRPDEESDGTRRLYGLLASVFMGKANRTYIIDELDTSLHPQLTYRFVKMFLEDPSSGSSQIIFTTHESFLMDFSLLRRDEIWFIEKSSDGSSKIYSLEDFNERNDRRVEKAYREGRYGGVPLFSSLFPPWGEE